MLVILSSVASSVLIHVKFIYVVPQTELAVSDSEVGPKQKLRAKLQMVRRVIKRLAGGLHYVVPLLERFFNLHRFCVPMLSLPAFALWLLLAQVRPLLCLSVPANSVEYGVVGAFSSALVGPTASVVLCGWLCGAAASYSTKNQCDR